MNERFKSFLLFLVSAAMTAGTIYLSNGMKLKPCPLCYYQRMLTFTFTAMILVHLLRNPKPGSFMSEHLLLIPIAGLCVALFHVYLELSGKLECPLGAFGIGTAPQQSLAGFALLTLLATIPTRSSTESAEGSDAAKLSPASVIYQVIFGALIAFAGIFSAPPLPKAPDKPYDSEKQPLVGCRPPFKK